MSLHKTISIHALREEGDVSATSGEQTRSISIHALREEGDASLPEGLLRRSISIHALREEGDIAVQHILERDANFYPRPPRGGRRISPSLARDSRTFLSTPSARRATQHQHRKRLCWCISIHALREEGDTGFGRLCCCGFPISIHALREEGDDAGEALRVSGVIISIHALREEGDAPQ